MPADLTVLGLGHLGLPAVRTAVSAGLATLGWDPDPAVVAALTAGRSPIEGVLTTAEVRRMLAAGFTGTADPADLDRVRVALLCSPTDPGPDGVPDPAPLRAAARLLAPRLRPGALVVVTSPVAPGTTAGPIRALLEEGSGLRAGRGFHLAHSPARTDPEARPPHTVPPPRVIGGHTPACTEAAAAFYTRLAGGERNGRPGTTPKIVRARGTREAETVTILETNLRQVNTALVNELAMACHDLGVDVWDVLRCAETHPSGPPAHRPGPGGPRPAIDPGRLPGVRRGPGGSPRMVGMAHSVNERMPGYVTDRVGALLNDHGKSVRDARILLLGVTHRADTADRTGSPADEIAHRLLDGGARLSYHDPHVPHWAPAGRRVPRADTPHEAAAGADLTLLLQAHSVYDLQGLAAKAPLLLDTRGVTPTGSAHRL